MKNYPKLPAVILAVICVFAFILGLFGYKTQYGEISTSHAAGLLNVRTGLGISDSIEMVFTWEDADETAVTETEKLLMGRLEYQGIYDYEIYHDLSNKELHVIIAKSDRSSYSVTTVYESLAKTGLLEIRAGYEVDGDGKPSGETAATVICTNNDLKSAKASTSTYSSYSVLYKNDFILKYSGDAKASLKEYSKKALQYTDMGYYSVWIDGEIISQRGFSSVISNGNVDAGDNTYNTSATEGFESYEAAILYGPLPVALEESTIYFLSDPDKSNNYVAVLYAIAASLAIFFIVMFVKARILGLCGAVAMVGYLGLLSNLVSGSFFSSSGLYVSESELGVYVAGYTAGCIFIMVICERVKSLFSANSTFRAVRNTFDGIKTESLLTAVIPVIGCCLYYLVISAFNLRAQMFYIVHSITVSCVCGYICLYLVFKCLASAASQLKLAKSEKVFGGTAK